ncbi:MAG: glutamate--tRNA ligase [Hyphomicrobiaceae bacterium]
MTNADTRSSGAAVVTRFAPSPTGTLHIGGARTALFNWLYTRHTGGKFLLRIEDTDRERSKDEHVAEILDSLKWLGLDWDGDPIFQFQRVERHREVATALLAAGKAYNCYLTPAELEAMREAARAEGRPQVIESPWRDRGASQAPVGIKPSVRLKTRRDGETTVDDLVQGGVVFPNKDLDDLIILRSDGAPTYNFAVVVDDHDMAVSHVIRGVDHLTNTARQTQVYQALDWPLPAFAHIPLVHGPDGAKLSKRHGAQGVSEYRAMGYLPAALRNYLVRLGWSHGNDEIFSTEQAIAWFDVGDVGKSAARFDFAKLADLNGHYIRQASIPDLLADLKALMATLPDGGVLEAGFSRVGWDKLEAALASLQERAKTLLDLIDGAGYLIAERPLALDSKATGLLDDAGRVTLAGVASALDGISEWTASALEDAVRAHAESAGLKLGKVAQPLRAALTGRAVSPPVFDVMAVLGREEALARIRDQSR